MLLCFASDLVSESCRRLVFASPLYKGVWAGSHALHAEAEAWSFAGTADSSGHAPETVLTCGVISFIWKLQAGFN